MNLSIVLECLFSKLITKFWWEANTHDLFKKIKNVSRYSINLCFPYFDGFVNYNKLDMNIMCCVHIIYDKCSVCLFKKILIGSKQANGTRVEEAWHGHTAYRYRSEHYHLDGFNVRKIQMIGPVPNLQVWIKLRPT